LHRSHSGGGIRSVVFDVQLTRHGLFEHCGAFNVNFVADINAHYEQFFNDSGQLTLSVGMFNSMAR